MMRLSEVATGKKVVIREFDESELSIKLMEMGCVPGEVIRIEQVAPLGDPISISVAGYRLSLRLNEAAHIFVDEYAEVL
jgi:ferrous iron transport protein A